MKQSLSMGEHSVQDMDATIVLMLTLVVHHFISYLMTIVTGILIFNNTGGQM